MTELRFPDPARSRALLIGASRFTIAGLDLPEIPAVRANLTDLRDVLTSSDTGVLQWQRCWVLPDPISLADVGTALSEAAKATDLLLVYYAGHGLLDEDGQLHLALTTTRLQQVRFTALPIQLLRKEIANSVAATRVLVLDCCFSGRAVETMTDPQTVAGSQLDVAGTYTLTSTTNNAPAHAPQGQRNTAFTGALLRTLNADQPLTLDQIYTAVDRDLAARNLPRPQRRVINAAGDLALSRGPSRGSPRRPDEPERVRFAPGWTALPRRFIRKSLPAILFFASPALASYATGLRGDSIQAILLGLLIILLVLFILLAVPLWYVRKLVLWFGGRPEPYVRELIIDRSGITVRRIRDETHLPWYSIDLVGVLGPSPPHINAPRFLGPRWILAVRLRPDAPMPGIRSMLNGEHARLGYLGLCSLEKIQTPPAQMISGLEKFAGDKLARSPRDFLDRDSRLRQDLV